MLRLASCALPAPYLPLSTLPPTWRTTIVATTPSNTITANISSNVKPRLADGNERTRFIFQIPFKSNITGQAHQRKHDCQHDQCHQSSHYEGEGGDQSGQQAIDTALGIIVIDR